MKSIHKFSIFLVSLIMSCQSLAIGNHLTGMQLGAEDAPVKIIEYRSLRCGHCADFSNEIFPELKEKYIDTGIVNFEVRPFPFDRLDLTAFQLLNCVDKKDFFAMDKFLFKNQKDWFVTNQSDKVLENSTAALMNYGKLFGISEEMFNECIEDEVITDLILEHRVEAFEKYDVSSTPTFIINGNKFSGNMPLEEFDKIIEKEIN